VYVGGSVGMIVSGKNLGMKGAGPNIRGESLDAVAESD